MKVELVNFPETPVAAIEHRGPFEKEYETAKLLIEWRIENKLRPDVHKSFGVHYTDPNTTAPEQHRVDFCVSYDGDIAPNSAGIVSKVIPTGLCARVTHVGPREQNTGARYLYQEWLPTSDYDPADFPVFFHYVNVGPAVLDADMVTDVYLPVIRKR